MTRKQRQRLTKTFAFIAIASMVIASIIRAILFLQTF
jgi:hypothetical protein